MADVAGAEHVSKKDLLYELECHIHSEHYSIMREKFPYPQPTYDKKGEFVETKEYREAYEKYRKDTTAYGKQEARKLFTRLGFDKGKYILLHYGDENGELESKLEHNDILEDNFGAFRISHH